MKQILIAGIGNIFHGDDAFGVEVVRELRKQPRRAEVKVTDFGIRAYDLAYALANGYDATILVDAMPRGQLPGTVCLVEPDLDVLNKLENAAVDARSMKPASVIQMAQSFGGPRGKLFLVGCEPAVLENDDEDFSLSEPVQAAVPRALGMIHSLVRELLGEPQNANSGLVPA
jgi:hydrogenase maturation protease